MKMDWRDRDGGTLANSQGVGEIKIVFLYVRGRAIAVIDGFPHGIEIPHGSKLEINGDGANPWSRVRCVHGVPVLEPCKECQKTSKRLKKKELK